MNPLLLVGVVPPPYHGQAVVTQMVFDLDYGERVVERLNLPFSTDLESVGGLQGRKLAVLWRGIMGLLSFWWRHRASDPVLYYCAGSANWVPLVKDMILLGVVGRLFKNRVVHYHSGGLPEWFAQNRVASVLGRVSYAGVSRAVGLTHQVAVPCYKGTEHAILANGLPVGDVGETPEAGEEFRYLYVGALREGKGIGVLLEAVSLMHEADPLSRWQVEIVGEWVATEEQARYEDFVSEKGIQDRICFKGRLVGEEKWAAYRRAEVFLFPSHYASENQPLVVIEAMGMGLAVVASEWRGIPELLGESGGVLVSPKDPAKLAEVMRELYADRDLRCRYREAGLSRYRDNYSVDAFSQKLQSLLAF